jgi:hypothetical protein
LVGFILKKKKYSDLAKNPGKIPKPTLDSKQIHLGNRNHQAIQSNGDKSSRMQHHSNKKQMQLGFLSNILNSPITVEWLHGEQDIALSQQNSNGATHVFTVFSYVERPIKQLIRILLQRQNRYPNQPATGGQSNVKLL